MQLLLTSKPTTANVLIYMIIIYYSTRHPIIYNMPCTEKKLNQIVHESKHIVVYY